MTEPGMNAVSIITPARTRPHRVKNEKTAPTKKWFYSFLTKAMGPVIKDIGTMFAEAEKRHRELERKHQELAKTVSDEVFRFRGVWRQDKTYPAGSVVTHSGGLWFAEETNDVKPGTGGGWRLVVKKGSFDDPVRRGKADR